MAHGSKCASLSPATLAADLCLLGEKPCQVAEGMPCFCRHWESRSQHSQRAAPNALEVGLQEGQRQKESIRSPGSSLSQSKCLEKQKQKQNTTFLRGNTVQTGERKGIPLNHFTSSCPAPCVLRPSQPVYFCREVHTYSIYKTMSHFPTDTR